MNGKEVVYYIYIRTREMYKTVPTIVGLNFRVILGSYGRVMEQRLRQKTKIYENQFGFMPGRSTMEDILSLRQFMEKYKAKRKNCIWSSSM
jgi:hypothetical protein